MSWLFSQALVAEYLEVTSSDGEPFAPLSGNPTQLAYLPPDKMTAFSRLSRFGMTFKPLTDDRGEELLTLFREVFRAKTSAAQGRGLDLMGSAQGCGEKWRGSSARYDQDSLSWKTHQYSLLGGLTEFSETWPRWGLMRNGELFPQQTLVPPTGETESGLLPTPLASLGTNGGPNQRDSSGRPGLQMAAMMWQTPVADDAVNRKARKWNSRGEPKLSAQVLWPTPTCGMAPHSQLSPESSQRELIRSLRDRGGPSTLAIAVQAKWPTPRAFMHKDSTTDRGKHNLGEVVGGSLNPVWVEWLMGWPLGWTNLKPLAMDRFHSWRQQHLNCSLENKK